MLTAVLIILDGDVLFSCVIHFFYFFPWLATGRIHYADERIRHDKKDDHFSSSYIHFFFPLWWERKKKCPTNCCWLFSQSHHLISSRRDNVFIRLAMTPFPSSRLSTSQQLRDHRVQQHSTTITNFLAETKIESMPKKKAMSSTAYSWWLVDNLAVFREFPIESLYAALFHFFYYY